MSHDEDNVLFLALQSDELDRFLVGEPFYFLETKDDNDGVNRGQPTIKSIEVALRREQITVR